MGTARFRDTVVPVRKAASSAGFAGALRVLGEASEGVAEAPSDLLWEVTRG